MSPPCQPYTRQGLQQGSEDARAKSFLYLMNVLKEMRNKPKYILVENVKGFEASKKNKSKDEIMKELIVFVGIRFTRDAC
jgi:tRNA (cytosine38-C5)-methyltransferase